MNKYIKPLVGLAVSAAMLTSCSPDFLNQESTGNITDDQFQDIAQANPKAVEGLVSGLYSLTFQWGTGGTSSDHTDFGQKSHDIAYDLMSGDMALSAETYGWFKSDAYLLNNRPTDSRTYMLWRYSYRLIKNANLILDALGGEDALPENKELWKYYGQTKALRAYLYFNMVNMYASQYQDDPNDMAMVFETLGATSGGLINVNDTYLFVESELLEAITALEGFARVNKNEIDADVAKGMLAYVYLQKGEYASAAQYAEEVITAANFTMLPFAEVLTSGFNLLSSKNWMWGIDLTVDNSPALPTFWGHVDIHTYSYAWAGDKKLINNYLRAQIPATDERAKWFDVEGSPDYKFYDDARGVGADEIDKNWDNDEVYMRIEEMYLIAAEGYARSNNLPLARTYLKALLEQRDPTVAATVDAMDQTALLNAILYNWRVEMWGEGKSLLTMKRYKATFKRSDNGIGYPGTDVSYDDTRLIFEIPQSESLTNPNL